MEGSGLLELLSEHVLVFDGAMGTQLQAADLTPADFTLTASTSETPLVKAAADRLGGKPLDGCNELLSLTRPDVVEGIHRAYLAAGSDLVETNTFGNTSIVMAEYDVAELVFEVSKASAQIARRACDAFSTSAKPRFVVGALGPGTKLVSLEQTSWDEVYQTYKDSFLGLLEGGADALLLETLQDLLMVKASVVAANDAIAEFGSQKPLIVQVTIEQTGTMLLGSEIGAALNMLECFPSVCAIGLNCATGPVEMAPIVRYLGQNSTRPISVQPNAGLPFLEKGRATYKLTPDELAEHHERFVSEYGAALVGGCCGTTPKHLAAVATKVGGRAHSANCHWLKVRHLFPGFDFELKSPDQSDGFALVGCSSLYQFMPYRQDSSFLIVGERTNANGSKAFRDALGRDNWEALTEIGRDVEAGGSHLLDVCAAYVGRNETSDMTEILTRFNRQVTAPLMIDSTEWPVMERSLQCTAGKPVLNSINFEDGEARCERVLRLARKYGAAVVGLTIDELGMAKSVEKKMEVAERLIARVRAAGLADQDLFIDCLTFTLGSGEEEFRKSAMATIEAIAQIAKLYPRVNTILGVSNVSFGLKPAARHVLNSAFLHYCREAGMTAAIVDAAKIRPESQIDPKLWGIASDLIHDRRVFAAA